MRDSLVRQLAVHLIAGVNPFPSWLSAEEVSNARRAIYNVTGFKGDSIFFMGKPYSLDTFRDELQREFPELPYDAVKACEDNLLLELMPQVLVQKAGLRMDEVQLSLLGNWLGDQESNTLSVKNVREIAEKKETLSDRINEGLIKVYQDKKLDTVTSLNSMLDLMTDGLRASPFFFKQYDAMMFEKKIPYDKALRTFLSQWLEVYQGFQVLSSLSKGATQYVDSLNQDLKQVFGEEVSQLYGRVYLLEPDQWEIDTDQDTADVPSGHVVLKHTGATGPPVGKSIFSTKRDIGKIKIGKLHL